MFVNGLSGSKFPKRSGIEHPRALAPIIHASQKAQFSVRSPCPTRLRRRVANLMMRGFGTARAIGYCGW